MDKYYNDVLRELANGNCERETCQGCNKHKELINGKTFCVSGLSG